MLWILSRSLGGIRTGCNLPREALSVLVAVGLFSDGIGNCLAECLPGDFALLADGQSRQVIRKKQ